MKKGIRTEIDWALIGAELANLGDQEQLDFFKAFIKECQSWGTSYQVEMQLASINRNLTEEEREVISMIGFKGE